MSRVHIDPHLGLHQLTEMLDTVCADRDLIVSDPPEIPTGCLGGGFADLEARLAESVAGIFTTIVGDFDSLIGGIEKAIGQVNEVIAVDEANAEEFAAVALTGAGIGGKF